jgi:hypothetical protein
VAMGPGPAGSEVIPADRLASMRADRQGTAAGSGR